MGELRLCSCWDALMMRERLAGLMFILQAHSCAILVGGTVSCWGLNSDGQVTLFVKCVLQVLGCASYCVRMLVLLTMF
jgi:hypothetical protein